jgi:hypothetical protein
MAQMNDRHSQGYRTRLTDSLRPYVLSALTRIDQSSLVGRCWGATDEKTRLRLGVPLSPQTGLRLVAIGWAIVAKRCLSDQLLVGGRQLTRGGRLRHMFGTQACPGVWMRRL